MATMAAPVTVNSPTPWMARRSRKRYDLDLQMLPVSPCSVRFRMTAQLRKSFVQQPTISIPRKQSLASVHSVSTSSPNSAFPDESSRAASIRGFKQADSCSSTSSSPIIEFQSKSTSQMPDSQVLSSLPEPSARPRTSSLSSQSRPIISALSSRRPSNAAVPPPDVIKMIRLQIAANEAQIAANCARMEELQIAGDQATAGIQLRLAAVSAINEQLDQLRTAFASM